MKDISSSNFGILIAFVLPGFVVLWGTSYFSETARLWLSGTDSSTPTVGGFMFVTLASVAAGVTVSTVRWLVIDTIHRWTGLAQPAWDFSRLQDNIGAYNVLNDIHYKFYQFHGNAEVALVFVYLARRIHLGLFTAPLEMVDAGFLLLAIILFIGSRDTLRKYFSRVSQLLGDENSQNGIRLAGSRPKECLSQTVHNPRPRPMSSIATRKERTTGIEVDTLPPTDAISQWGHKSHAF